MLWITVGGKPKSGGTSIEGAGVFAVNVKVITGVSGSSLVIVNVHDFGPGEVGVNLITKPRQESGLTVAGNGLLINVKSGQFTDALVT